MAKKLTVEEQAAVLRLAKVLAKVRFGPVRGNASGVSSGLVRMRKEVLSAEDIDYVLKKYGCSGSKPRNAMLEAGVLVETADSPEGASGEVGYRLLVPEPPAEESQPVNEEQTQQDAPSEPTNQEGGAEDVPDGDAEPAEHGRRQSRSARRRKPRHMADDEVRDSAAEGELQDDGPADPTRRGDMRPGRGRRSASRGTAEHAAKEEASPVAAGEDAAGAKASAKPKAVPAPAKAEPEKSKDTPATAKAEQAKPVAAKSKPQVVKDQGGKFETGGKQAQRGAGAVAAKKPASAAKPAASAAAREVARHPAGAAAPKRPASTKWDGAPRHAEPVARPMPSAAPQNPQAPAKKGLLALGASLISSVFGSKGVATKPGAPASAMPKQPVPPASAAAKNPASAMRAGGSDAPAGTKLAKVPDAKIEPASKPDAKLARKGRKDVTPAAPAGPRSLAEVPQERQHTPEATELRRKVVELDPRLWFNGWLLSFPEAFSLHEGKIRSLDGALRGNQTLGDGTLTQRQLSYRVFSDEKFLERDGDGRKLLERMGLRDIVSTRPEPRLGLLHHVPHLKPKMRIVVTENFDPWFDIRELMYAEGRTTFLGEEVDGVIFGNGYLVDDAHKLPDLLESLGCGEGGAETEVIYWGDIDRAGLQILERLYRVAEGKFVVRPFVAAYAKMARLAAERFPDPLDNELSAQEGVAYDSLDAFCAELPEDVRDYVREVVVGQRLVPQEILTRAEL